MPEATASREIFWNIGIWGGIVLYPLSAAVVAFFAYTFYKRSKLWRIGRGKAPAVSIKKRIKDSIRLAALDGLLQRRVLKEPYPGIMHFLLFWGSLVMLAASAMDAASHYLYPFLEGAFYLVFSAVVDVLGLAILAGVVIAGFRRYVQRPARLDNQPQDAVALSLIGLVVVTGFLVEGFRISATELVEHPSWAVWSPGGLILANLFSGLSESAKLLWHQIMWWSHVFLVLGGTIYVCLAFNRLGHIVIDPLNAFFRPHQPMGRLNTIDIQSAESFGAGDIREFSWKDLLDLDACTRCGRCQANCPANIAGKTLSPKKVVQDLKSEMVAQIGLTSPPSVPQTSPQTSGMIRRVTEDAIWDCTTCGACIVHCPVYITPLGKIVEMRRHLTLMSGKMPEAVQMSLASLQKKGNPYAGSQYLRLRDDWTAGINLKRFSEDRDIDILFWVGCTAALHERVVKVTHAFVGLMQKAGLNFGIMEETCCGDPARRLGYEVLYQELAQRNINMFKKYQIKKIVTLCPHCFNTLKHEYDQIDPELQKEEFKYEVWHHSQLLSHLVQSGKLKPGKTLDRLVTYHDPCYLGRYNGVYREPRLVLDSIPGLKRIEMKRSKERSFCCGGGGGHLWMEEEKGKRVNDVRMADMTGSKANTGITACPYCLTMLETAAESKLPEERLELMDISELLARAVD